MDCSRPLREALSIAFDGGPRFLAGCTCGAESAWLPRRRAASERCCFFAARRGWAKAVPFLLGFRWSAIIMGRKRDPALSGFIRPACTWALSPEDFSLAGSRRATDGDGRSSRSEVRAFYW